MDSLFAEKKARALIVDSQSTIRQLFAENLRKSGYTEIFQVDSLAEAIHILEAEPIDWLITSLFATGPVNALQLLRMAVEQRSPFFRTTLLLDENELECLDAAFELGLLSWMKKPLTRESIQTELASLLQMYERTKWNPTVTSAKYLHKWLHEGGHYARAQDIERTLLTQYPANAEVLLLLADSQIHMGQGAAASTTLKTAKMVEPALKAEIEAMQSDTGEVSSSSDKIELSVFGIKSAAVVFPNEETCASVVAALRKAGITDIIASNDGLLGANEIKSKKELHLVVQDWQLPTLAGHVFLQRVRQFQPTVPVIVVTDKINNDDRALLLEMGVTDLIPSAADANVFLEKLSYAMLQSALASQYPVQERQFRQALAAGKRDDALALKSKMFSDLSVTLGQKKYIDAELEFFDGNFDKAREQALDAMRFGNENVLTLNLLAKALTKLGDLEFALKCFSKAQAMSPQNIERLCNIAEVNSELNEKQKAHDSLEQAKGIDDENVFVKETEAKVAIAEGNSALAKAALEGLDSLTGFFSFMNNKAVVLSRSGKSTQAIDLYKNVIDALKARAPEELYVVHYNLALARVKSGELKEALSSLNIVIKNKSNRVFDKARALAARVEAAIKKGETSVALQTRAPSAHAAAPSSAVAEKLNTVLSEPKLPFCCYGLYLNEGETPAKIRNMYAKMPAFKPRPSIKREEAFGAERALKSEKPES